MSFNAQIQVYEDTRQGYTVVKPRLMFADHGYDYTEDTGTIFKTCYGDNQYLVSSVCDGHSGYMTSFYVTSIIEPLFKEAISETDGNVYSALERLFEKIHDHVAQIRQHLGTSGSTCNVIVFEPLKEKVFVASLGDSPTLRYSKNALNQYELSWKSEDQDCSNKKEIERMVACHHANGDYKATENTVVVEVKINERPTGVFRNTRTLCTVQSSFGDFANNYFPGMVNTTPNIYELDWSSTQDDVWIQCSDGLLEGLTFQKLGIQPQSISRVHEIAGHLNTCVGHENVAHSLHEMQIDSMLSEKFQAHPTRKDSTREWIENTFDNHITKVFMWKNNNCQ
jgi:serine/threonine protein phosphatase PrpC